MYIYWSQICVEKSTTGIVAIAQRWWLTCYQATLNSNTMSAFALLEVLSCSLAHVGMQNAEPVRAGQLQLDQDKFNKFQMGRSQEVQSSKTRTKSPAKNK